MIKEAMAEESPIVSTPVGDAPEPLGGVPACYLRPRELAALADPLAAALERGRVRGAHTAAAPLAREKVAERIAAVHEEAVARHAGGRRRWRGAHSTLRVDTSGDDRNLTRRVG